MTAPVVLEAQAAASAPSATRRAWLVFAVSFGLLLSDYMSRQVLAAVFPLLKAEWSLTDARLGALGGAVALMVGLFTFPLSLIADRIGRAKAVAAMAFLWSLATLACALCATYGQLLAARFALGLGEAAYGSVGLAVVFGYFPRNLRATITGAFMAGGVFGSFIGLSLGGAMAARFGWRGAFAVMAGLGLLLTAAYLVVVSDDRSRGGRAQQIERPGRLTPRIVAQALFGSPQVVATCLAGGLQLFVMGALTAWAPSYLNRQFGLAVPTAALAAAALLLLGGVGMVALGGLADHAGARRPQRRFQLAGAYGVVTFVGLEAALALPPGPLQLACAALGVFCAAGASGPAGAIVADGVPAGLHGAAFAVATLANNLLGLAPGPAVTGLVADHIGLRHALQLAPLAALFSAAGFWAAARLKPSHHS